MTLMDRDTQRLSNATHGAARRGEDAGLTRPSLRAGLRTLKRVSDRIDDSWLGDLIGMVALAVLAGGLLVLALVLE